MCGIAGYIGKRALADAAIQATLVRMQNRGPDDQSFVQIEQGNLHIALLHSRLSIIDLDARANQPFTIGECTIVFNGEIYNYVELRTELEKCGVAFHTASDTEVLLQYYLRYGAECVRYFEGMWSFAIYDRRTGMLLLSRDRFAEKPLYYVQTTDGLYFGSEVKFLKSLSDENFSVNKRQIQRYLVNGYKSLYKTGETFFTDVKELPYATNAVIGGNLLLRNTSYWKPEVRIQPMSLHDAIEGARHHLIESMKIRLRADVPLAFCLSGGVDSAALASIAAKEFNCDVASFSIVDPDERYNEYENIKATVDDIGCKNTIIELSHEASFERLQRLVAYHDAPVYTISYHIHSYLSEAISANGYKVAFSGTSADELFTGYYDHFNLHLHEMRQHPNYSRYKEEWQQHIASIVRNPHLQNPELYADNSNFRGHIYLNNDEFASYLTDDFAEEFIEERFCDSLLRNRMLNEVFYEGTRVILHEDDLNSMCYSVENRSPFLDTRLFDFCYSVPSEHLIRDGYGKYVLREAVKGILNDKVRLDRKKKGFNASISSVFNLQDPVLRDYLLNPEAEIFTVVRRDAIEKLLDMNPIPNSYSKFLFSFMNARIFLELNA